MKKIVFGSILSAFLLVSMGFMSPVQVQAAENEVKDIWDDVCSLAEDLTSDPVLNDLLDSTIFKSIFLDYNSDNISAEQYINELKNSSEWSKLIMLEEKYGSKLEKLNSSFNNWFNTVGEDVSDSGVKDFKKYFRLYTESGEIKVRSQGADEVSGDDVLLIVSDSSIVIKTVDWEYNYDFPDKIFFSLFFIGLITGFIGVILINASSFISSSNPSLSIKLKAIAILFYIIFTLSFFSLLFPIITMLIIWYICEFLNQILEDISKPVVVANKNFFKKINLFLKSRFLNLFNFF